jgi:hypothetical protein
MSIVLVVVGHLLGESQKVCVAGTVKEYADGNCGGASNTGPALVHEPHIKEIGQVKTHESTHQADTCSA